MSLPSCCHSLLFCLMRLPAFFYIVFVAAQPCRPSLMSSFHLQQHHFCCCCCRCWGQMTLHKRPFRAKRFCPDLIPHTEKAAAWIIMFMFISFSCLLLVVLVVFTCSCCCDSHCRLVGGSCSRLVENHQSCKAFVCATTFYFLWYFLLSDVRTSVESSCCSTPPHCKHTKGLRCFWLKLPFGEISNVPMLDVLTQIPLRMCCRPQRDILHCNKTRFYWTL